MHFPRFLEYCQQRVDSHLTDKISPYNIHQRLQDAMHYSLFNGGKRIRPILAYASASAIGEMTLVTDNVAAAIEAVHAYSLIHDDLPSMDNDDLRRGKPTCHIAFDEATAILAGDALQALGFTILSSHENQKHIDPQIQLQMLHILSSASGAQGMVAGQSLDLSAINQTLSLEQLEQMHRLKTGALINASICLGALSTGIATDAQLAKLALYADAVGLAFQVQDDILDVTGDTSTLGKQQGADAVLNKPTYVSLLGLDESKRKATELHEQALSALSIFDYRADYLRHLSGYIVNRRH